MHNGLTLVVAPVSRLPICTIALVVDAGAEFDQPGQEGLGRITARTVADGTRELHGTQFTEQLERLGASLTVEAGWDSVIVSTSVAAERLPAALELLSSAVAEPALREDEIERLRHERLSAIAQNRTEPRGLANEALARVLYTDDSRYAVAVGGNSASVKAVQADAIKEHHRTHWLPGRITAIVAGDVTPAAVESCLSGGLGAWPAPPAATAPTARRGESAVRETRLHVVNRDQASQSELRVARVAVPRSHPDYFPLTVMNAVLGGLFSSRINLNLREKHGYTYGAHSSVEWRRGAGPFVIRTAVETGVTADSIREILREIERLRSEPVSMDELVLAREYLAGVFPIRFETSPALAAGLAQIVTHALPADYFDTYRGHVSAVTADDVLRSAICHLEPAGTSILAVGDAAQVTKPLQELGLGGVEEVSLPPV